MTLRITIAVQAILICIVLFGDIGFDKPGRFGLHFTHLIIIAVIYLGALISGCIGAVKRRKPALLVAQLLLLAIGLAYGFWAQP